MNPSPHLLHCTYLHADVETRIPVSVSAFLQVFFIASGRMDILISFALFALLFCIFFFFHPYSIPGLL